MKIRADLRTLLENQQTSAVSTNVFAADTSVPFMNSTNFNVNDFILIGVLGSETAEIRKIGSISGNTVVVTVALTFDHPQDTIITLFDYDQVIFYHSATTTSALIALAAAQNLVADNIYNYYNDTSNATGYGWVRYYNSVTTLTSDASNPVPYAGWADNSVKLMFDTFYTQITNREKKLIKDADVYRWLNEAYTIARNRLNLSNREYTVPTPQSLSIIGGTAEYALPDYFARVRTVTDNVGNIIPWIAYEDVPNYMLSVTPPGGTLQTKYYLRGNYIGFSPTPSVTATYSLYYQRTAPVLSTYIDYIELPAGNHYFLLDYLMYRATPIIGGNPDVHLKAFDRGLNELIITTHKQSGNRDSWGIDTRIIV